MEKRKLTKADIDQVRNIEGFPIAKDEDIIALSDPPYYTACPNPFIEEFIRENGKPYDEATDDYHREPFAADVSEGKNDPIYNAHSYHTKVPHKAIMRYILHYTDPGDIVFDGFCGTGMTGVAAQMCGNPDEDFKAKIDSEMPYVKWGKRRAILNDLSPAATFIAYNYNTPLNVQAFYTAVEKLLDECEKAVGWVYQTRHVDLSTSSSTQIKLDAGPIMGKVNYVVWSDVLICPHCGSEFIYYEITTEKKIGIVQESFRCNHCQSALNKRQCEKAIDLRWDDALNRSTELPKQVPVLIDYNVGRKRYQKTPDQNDIDLIEKIASMKIDKWYPILPMMHKGERWGDLWRAGYHKGITHAHQFYTKRNLYVLTEVYDRIIRIEDKRIRDALLFGFNNVQQRHCKLNAMRFNVSFPSNITSGTLFMPSLMRENNILSQLSNKYLKRLIPVYKKIIEAQVVSTGSATNLTNIPDDSIDYIFTDPPFGSNLHYAELNFLWEAWLKNCTNITDEAVVNDSQKKGVDDYRDLMKNSFEQFYRVLKPGHWMTVEFHNSQNSIWNAIQEALLRAGFIIADIRTLDKQGGSFKQVNSTSAVQQDLVLSVYKPRDNFKQRFITSAGNNETVWSFVRQHLEQLPVVVVKNNRIELISERQAFLLFDRMVAFHLMNGVSVPIDATDFYKGLDEKFIKRDGMYFLADQVNEYDDARIKNELEDIQFSLIVSNEKTAIAWLYAQLVTPQTYAEIQPKFMQEIKTVDKYEAIPELAVLLEDNFLKDDNGKWYIPDRTKEADIAKLREKKLLKEFEGYLETRGKLKLFRTEAIRAGFAKLWADKNYKLIVETANRLPEEVIQEDDKLLMYYDLSLGRV